MALTRRTALLLPGGLLAASLFPRPALAQLGPQASAPPRPGPHRGTLAGPRFFVLGAFIAPPNEMAKWKLRGINTIIGVGQGVDAGEHHVTAIELGLAQIRQPRQGRLQADLKNPSVIAFETDDEPTNIVDGHVRQTPDDVTAQMRPWQRAADAAGIVKPIWTNHIGNHIWQAPSRVGLDLAEYHTRSDWYGSDTYQIADGHGNLLTQGGSASTYQGHVLRLQRQMAPDAPLLAFVQTVAYASGKAVPTPGQLKTQIWSSVINGAAMVAAFPVRLTPTFAWDGTPPALVATLETEFAEIAALERVLIDIRAGGTRPGLVYPAAAEGASPKPGQLPFPFEARTVHAPAWDYTIIANLSDAPARLTYAPWRLDRVAFAANEVMHGRTPRP